MDTILGLLGLIVFATCIIGIAAACTWAVVKLSPSRDSQKTQ